MINVIVAFSKPEDGKNIKNILVKHGFPVLFVCTCGSQVLAAVSDLENAIIVSGFRFKDMNCRQLSEQLPVGFALLLVASKSRWSGEDMGEMVCLPTPFKVSDLVSSVRLMDKMKTEQKRMPKRQRGKRNEQDQRLIEAAKGLLIEKNGMTEPEAHKYLQKCSMDSGTNLIEASKMVLSLYR